MSVDKAPYLGPRGFTIFCDDLREEKTGKITCVGVYSELMYLPDDLPKTLPALCFFIHLYCHENDLFETLEIHISMPWDEDKPFIITEVPRDKLKEVKAPDQYKDPIFGGYRLGIRLTSSPFVVHSFGRIRVKAIWDGTMIPIGSLIILPSPQTQERE